MKKEGNRFVLIVLIIVAAFLISHLGKETTGYASKYPGEAKKNILGSEKTIKACTTQSRPPYQAMCDGYIGSKCAKENPGEGWRFMGKDVGCLGEYACYCHKGDEPIIKLHIVKKEGQHPKYGELRGSCVISVEENVNYNKLLISKSIIINVKEGNFDIHRITAIEKETGKVLGGPIGKKKYYLNDRNDFCEEESCEYEIELYLKEKRYGTKSLLKVGCYSSHADSPIGYTDYVWID